MARHLKDIMNEIMRLCRSASSNQSRQSKTPSTNTTSCLLVPTVYGRDAEIESIKDLIMSNKSNGITVLPIVGLGGIGKSTMSQCVYNDPEIGNQFEIKIWVHVSDEFNVVRITREILEVVSSKKYKIKSNLNMLQQDLASHMKSKKFLIVLDDVWDVTTNDCWDMLLGPLRPNDVNPSEVEVTGNTIIVTTRIQTVAKSCGTVGSINLEALEDDDIWDLLQAYAFGNNNNPDSYPTLHVLGKQIVREINGNPLAAKTVGRLLRRNLNVDDWNSIVKNKLWQSLQHTNGIMYALKLSYDHLPRHLQRCFCYCSLFPKGYSFSKAQLIQIWIAQGFVEKSGKGLEQKGWEYLAELVDSGFFQQVESSSSEYVMHDLMHDLSRMVSQTECATIDGLECTELVPTIRHLSIITDSTYHKDQNGNISRNEFETRLPKVISRSKLRTLVLIGKYDAHFFQSFRDAFKEAQHLRLLHIASSYADFDSFLSSLNYSHLRYLRLENKESHGALPQDLSKCYHLQVLDIDSCGTPNIPDDINNLVSLRHLVAQKGVCSSIANIGKMTSLQELDSFIVKNLSGFEVTQLKQMNKLVQLGVSGLENITQEEACGASLKDKQHLEMLGLSWNDACDGYGSGISYENDDDNDRSSENEYDSGMSSEPSLIKELDGLEPHGSLKHLRISGYNGAASPTWLSSSLTYLQTLHLESCGKWQRIPLERLSMLTKLVLIKMRNATEVSIPSLEELVLILPSLNTFSCTSVRNLNDNLKVLKIMHCPALKVFPLFENCQQLEIEPTSWLSHLSKLTIYNCPLLCVHNPLPPSSNISELSIRNVSTLPTMEVSSNGTLRIGLDPDLYLDIFDEPSDQLEALDDKVLSFHKLRFLTKLIISGCQNLTTISFKGLRQLVCLKTLELYRCPELLSSNIPPELTFEYMSGANRGALPPLEHVDIVKCGITGKWLCLMLQHAHALKELSLHRCNQITGLLIGEEENSQPSLMSSPEAPSLGYPGRDELLCHPLNPISSLRKLSIKFCSNLTFY
uniref:Uncharacterized protein n=1 Tax=Oryza brachyantha TaxID=4533 RepID=J3M1I8_ORYBR